jgi:hypothetical protein
MSDRIEEMFEVSPNGYSYNCKKCKRPFYSLKAWHQHARQCLGNGPEPGERPASRPAVQLSIADFREGMVQP